MTFRSVLDAAGVGRIMSPAIQGTYELNPG
jgi:hypothetical protein